MTFDYLHPRTDTSLLPKHQGDDSACNKMSQNLCSVWGGFRLRFGLSQILKLMCGPILPSAAIGAWVPWRAWAGWNEAPPCCWWRRRGGWGRTLPHSWGHSDWRIAFKFLLKRDNQIKNQPGQEEGFQSACRTKRWYGGCLPTITPDRREERSPNKDHNWIFNSHN